LWEWRETPPPKGTTPTKVQKKGMGGRSIHSRSRGKNIALKVIEETKMKVPFHVQREGLQLLRGRGHGTKTKKTKIHTRRRRRDILSQRNGAV